MTEIKAQGNCSRSDCIRFSELICFKVDMLHRYYFDLQDGRALRDAVGLPFETDSGAIEHSKDLARRLRNDPRVSDRALSIAVRDQDGREVHREVVYPSSSNQDPLESSFR